MERPEKNEYAPSYQKYIDLVEAGDFFELLDKNTEATIALFKSIAPDKENYRYAAEKWTVKEVIVHMIDTERGFSYRALVCMRHDDRTPLYAMNEKHYGKHVDVSAIAMNRLIQEFRAVRAAFKLLYLHNTKDSFTFLGQGIGHPISARALGYLAIGHVRHHCAVLQQKYFA